jgi:hypothetical protein
MKSCFWYAIYIYVFLCVCVWIDGYALVCAWMVRRILFIFGNQELVRHGYKLIQSEYEYSSSKNGGSSYGPQYTKGDFIEKICDEFD